MCGHVATCAYIFVAAEHAWTQSISSHAAASMVFWEQRATLTSTNVGRHPVCKGRALMTSMVTHVPVMLATRVSIVMPTSTNVRRGPVCKGRALMTSMVTHVPVMLATRVSIVMPTSTNV